MRVLGIESSCDETAAAVVDDEGRVLSDVVRSQIEAHAPYGGIVPEIAARDHIRAIAPVVRKALDDAGVTLAEVDGIAATHRPGLVGALLVGLQMAKGLAWASGRPLVGVDHLFGHLLSPFLRRRAPSGDWAEVDRPSFPFVGLLVSGGHSAIYRCDAPAPERVEELGATRDDALGEAFDKVAKLLGLGYPGGPVIDRLAASGDPDRAAIALPRPMPGSLEMSFSGMKSAMARHIASPDAPRDPQAVADLCACFQRAVTEALVDKTVRAARAHRIDCVVVAGGVAANRELRARMKDRCDAEGLRLCVPPFQSCTDNAAMIAYAGALGLGRARGEPALALGPSPRTLLPRITRKGRGKR